MFTFLHAADIHLDSPLQKLERYEGAPVEELRQATRRAFENLVDLAMTERVDFILISGDLYDGDWKDYNTGLYFIAQMAKLREAGIPVYIISGNHDAANKMTRTLRFPDSVHLFSSDKPETICLDDLGVAIHGLSFPTASVSRDLSIGYPMALRGYFNLGLLHTCVNGREGHVPYSPCTMEGLRAKGYDYWALGHIHQREILNEEPFIVFPGNIQGRHIRESGSKGCVQVRVSDDGQVRLKFRPLDVIRWMRCEVDAALTEVGHEVIDLVGGKLETLLTQSDGLPLVARIEVSGSCRAHADLMADPERWTNEIRSLAIDTGGGRFWIEKVKLTTIPPSRGSSTEFTDGPIGELLAVFDEIRSNPDRLRILGEPLADLWKKLPREVRENKEVIAPEDTEWLSSMLDRAKAMLLHRLKDQEK